MSSPPPASPLPPLYAAWMTELLGGPLPSEPRSTCMDCAMVATGPEAEDPGPHFRPDLKCCMFLPKLPNFLVGRALAEGGPGRASVLGRVSEPRQRTPLGLTPPVDLAERHEAARKDQQFGQDLSLRCPHFIDERGGLCGIWTNRESICTTWFCRHTRGAVSRQLWSALQRLLAVLEDTLSRWVAVELGAGPRSWGVWQGKEADFYEAAGARVSSLTWREVAHIGGFELRFRAQLLKEARRAVHELGVPPVLVAAEIQTLPLPDGRLRVFGYSQYDPEDLAVEVVALLGHFTGRAVAEILDEPDPRALSRAALLPEATLQRLFDLRVLDLPPET